MNIYIVFVLDIGILNSRGDMEVWGILGWKRVKGIWNRDWDWELEGLGIGNREIKFFGNCRRGE